MSKKTSPSEWSYIFDTTDLPENGAALNIAPDEDECAALVRRLGILALNDVRADIAIMPDKRGTVHVQGIITAQVVQSCVTTLEPVTTDIKDDFDAWFADPDTVISFAKAQQERKSKGDERPILPESEDPESMIDGKIDLGEVVVQFLSLSLPAFPHATGVEPVGDDPAAHQTSEKRENPFAALKDWKDRQR